MRMIFGVRTSETLCLSIIANGQLPPQPPDLRIKTTGQDAAIACSNGIWVATLEAGDHIVYMPASGDSWVDAPLAIALSPSATIVSCGAVGTPLAWTAATATSDPKNPGPPPSVSAVPLTNSPWLGSTLTMMSPQVTDARSFPSYPSRSH